MRKITDVLKKSGKAIEKPFEALKKEAKLGPVLHDRSMAVLKMMKAKNKAIEEALKEAHGYAIVPDIGKASLVLGGAYGLGEVFEQGRVIGYCAIVQLTIGVQVGGETFHELVVFHDKGALDRFKTGKFAFAADAATVMVKAGAEANKGFGAGTSTFATSEGGMLLSLMLGGQKFIFKPAALGRLRTDKGETNVQEDEEGEEASRAGGAEGESHPEQP